jgi:uncharacterized protein YggE
MFPMSSIVVRGTSAASVTPDRAELSLEVSQRAADAAGALDSAAAASQRLVEVLERHGIDRNAWATDGIHVGEDYEWRDNQQVMVGFRASTGVTVTIRGADLVGTLVRDAVGDAGAAVRNLVWKVDRDNPARRQLLADAAVDARVRATAYAEALGLRLGEVELISETPIAPDNPPGHLMMAAMASPKMSDAEMAVSGGLVELTADVHVRFALLR